MKKYFVYELKKSTFTLTCLAVICTIIYLTPMLSNKNDYLGHYTHSLYLWITAVEGGVLAFMIPFRQFYYKMKKRSADLYFSLPLSHTKIFTVKYLVGLILVFAPYTVSFLLGAFTMMIKTTAEINAVYYVAQYLATIVPVYIIYAVSSFAFTRASKATDGVIFAVFWALVLAAIVSVFAAIIRTPGTTTDYDGWSYREWKEYLLPEYYAVFSPLTNITETFTNLIVLRNYNINLIKTVDIANMCVGYTLTALMGAGATVWLFLTEKRARFENIEQVSDSIFGYKVMLPLFTVCISVLCYIELFTVVFVAVGAFLVTVVYKRTFKIGKKQAIIYAASVLAGLVIAVICSYVYEQIFYW